VCRDRFSLAIGVARQIDGIRGVRRFAQIIDDFAFASDDLQRGLKDFVVVDADLLPGRFL
jgi:hypothetical protein